MDLTLSDAVSFRTDANGQFQVCQPALERLSGQSEEGIDAWFQMIHPQLRDAFVIACQKSFQSGQILRHTTRVYSKSDNEYHLATFRATPNFSEGNTIESWSWFCLHLDDIDRSHVIFELSQKEKNASAVSSLITGGGQMGELIRNKDWSGSPLENLSQWPETLLMTVSTIINSHFPTVIFGGPELALLYNDAFIPVLGLKHPQSLGQPLREAFAEVFPILKPMLDGVFQTGVATWSTDLQMLLLRDGVFVESYFTFSYSPMRDHKGEICGIFCPVSETTSRVISERRLLTVRELGYRTSQSLKTVDEVLRSVGEVLSENLYDVPFSLVYQLDSETMKLLLKATSSLSFEHPAAVRELTVGNNQESPWSAAIAQALEQRSFVLVNDLERQFGPMPGGKWDESTQTAAVFPIGSVDNSKPLGVLIVGINLKRPFDHDYQAFVELMTRQIANGICTAMAYESEKKKAEELEALDRAKTVFFSNTSHEFRTPLTLILGPLEDCLSADNTTLSAQDRERLVLIQKNVWRLLKLVNSLLDFSRIEVGRIEASYSPVDISRLTLDLTSVFRSAIENAGLNFEVNVEQFPQQPYIDADMYEKIVANLLSNAFKFTLKGTIRVDLKAVENSFQLTVSDTGCGIKPEEIDHVFERFYRASSANGRSFEGTGIGLALTSELVKFHRGQISVQSEYEKGTSFVVTIPFGKGHLPSDRIFEKGSLEKDLQTSSSTSKFILTFLDEAWTKIPEEQKLNAKPSSSNMEVPESRSGDTSRNTVCIVDDNADLRMYLKRLLEPIYNIQLACDGEEALEKILANPPDLVVSDVMMPKLDGYGLIKALRAKEITKAMPIILLSARAGEESSIEGLKVGADDYLVKPFSARELLARVKTQIELGKLRFKQESLVMQRTQQLAESEQRYRILTQLSPVGVFQKNEQARITFTNDRWKQITGYVGDEWVQGISEEDQETFRVLLQQASEVNIVQSEFLFHHPSGKDIWLLEQGLIYQDGHKSFIGTLTDVTERKQQELERVHDLLEAEKMQRRRAIEADENRRNQELFVDTICHEIRNPLSGMLTNCDLLRSFLETSNSLIGQLNSNEELNSRFSELVKDQFGAITAIEACVQHQRRITDDVLNVSRIKAGKFDLNMSSFNVRDLIKSVVRMVEAEARSLSIQLETTISPAVDGLVVRSDPQRIVQIMINLLSNSIKFTRTSSSKIVTVNCDLVPQSPSLSNRTVIQIKVRDTGIGMTAEEQAQIFTRFQQGKNQVNGSGLGLFITKSLIDLLGGTIVVSSSKFNGTEFIFTLPCDSVETDSSTTLAVARPNIFAFSSAPMDPATAAIASGSSIPSSSSTDLSVPAVPVVSILIVEDNVINQVALKRQLEICKEFQFSIEVASNGLEAVDLEKKCKFDVILMDIQMPEMDGMEATRLIRQREQANQLPPIPIIALSGNSRQEYVDLALQAGMNDYIKKPYQKDVLLAQIRRFSQDKL